ncbi:MAG: LytTR family DNA-binding domain-containing protein [Agathobacter sp.]|nr:LytTR family DNA-binding domain-containing protein [Agathobacter sp.]
MISVLMSNNNLEEYKLITDISNKVSFGFKEELKITEWNVSEKFEDIIENMDTLDAAIIDVTAPEGIDAAKLLRRKFASIELVIVSDATISPIVYLNPEVRATSLLLKPFDEALMCETLRNFFSLFDNGLKSEECYIIHTKNEMVRLPYCNIIYFEARDKKVFVRLNSIEYTTYDTIEYLSEILPEIFIRCHRSFIANRKFIDVVNYSKNIVLLFDNMSVPLSRSYKSSVKEAMKNGK